MPQAARPMADEMLEGYVAQGRTLIERASLIGDASDYESWKAEEKHWIELTLHMLERVYDSPEPAERFRNAAAVGLGRPWHLEYRHDAECVRMGIDVLLSLEPQPQAPLEEAATADITDALTAGAGLGSQAGGPALGEHETFPGSDLAASPMADAIAPVPATLPDPGHARSGQVFLVHGRNEACRQSVADLLQGAGHYEVTVLNERPAERLALVEGFDDHSVDGRYAVVLLTADDVGAPRLDNGREPYFSPRARQGVVFELGVLVAVLSPRYVCVLYESGVELPCDLDGVTFIHLDPAGTWRSKLLLQLRAAGFDYDLNQLARF